MLVEEYPRDQYKNPLFDIFISQAQDLETDNKIDVNENIIRDGGLINVKFDLSLFFTKINKNLLFELHFNKNIYSLESIQIFLQNFTKLTKNVLTNPNNPICKIDIRSNEYEKYILYSNLNKSLQKNFDSFLSKNNIGKTKIYVMNDINMSVPIGGIGNICIESSFLPKDEYKYQILQKTTTGKHLVRTNIKAIRINRSIIFLGTEEERIKIDGEVIYFKKLEYEISKNKLVSNVMVVKHPLNNKALIVFIVPSKFFKKETQIKEILHVSKPQLFFKLMNKLPKIENGEISNAELTDIKSTASDLKVRRESKEISDIERRIILIFKEELQIEKVELNENLFEMGINSMNLSMIIAKIHDEFDVLLDIARIFEEPTISFLVDEICERKLSENKIIKKIII